MVLNIRALLFPMLGSFRVLFGFFSNGRVLFGSARVLGCQNMFNSQGEDLEPLCPNARARSDTFHIE